VRIVRTFEYEGTPGHVILETTSLREENGRTKLTVRALFATPLDRDGMLNSGMEQGAGEGYDRFAALLQEYKEE
jgi:hypothetical protein